MDIAALSMQMHTQQLNQNVELAIAKKTMDVQETAAENLIQTIENIPSFGHTIDMLV